MKTLRQLAVVLALALAVLVGMPRARAQGYVINVGDILIANYNGGSVVKIDPGTGAQERLGGAFAVPTDLVMDANGILYITEWGTQQGGSRIKRLDLKTRAVTTLMDVGSGPSQVWGITQGPTGDLFITSRGNHGVYRVNCTTGVPTLLTQSDPLYTPIGIDMLDANHLVVSCLLVNRLVSVSLVDNSQSVILEGGGLDQPWGVGVTGTDIYVAGYDRKDIQRVSAGGVLTTIATMTGFPYGLAVGPDGNLVVGLKDVGEEVVRLTPAGVILRSYTGSLIRQATGVEVARFAVSPPPTAAQLDYFRAVGAGERQVALGWRTLVEVQVLGFHLDRETEDGRWERITRGIIAAEGSDQRPHDYRFEDRNVGKVSRLRYRLVEVNLKGEERVVAEAQLARNVAMWIARSGEGVVIQAQGEPAASVTLEVSLDLVQGAWKRLETIKLDEQGNGKPLRRIGSDETAQFYRIRYAETLPTGHDLGSSTANDVGILEYSNTPPPATVQRFNRSVYP